MLEHYIHIKKAVAIRQSLHVKFTISASLLSMRPTIEKWRYLEGKAIREDDRNGGSTGDGAFCFTATSTCPNQSNKDHQALVILSKRGSQTPVAGSSLRCYDDSETVAIDIKESPR
jgi:hypothetical protein